MPNNTTLNLPKQNIISNESEPIIQAWSIPDTVPIPQIPMIYPIEKTHVIVKKIPPSIITSNISNHLKQNSIAHTIDSNNPCIAKCSTFNHVNFIIRLYSVAASSDILVELQRVSGCAVAFHSTCKHVLNAAKGENDANKSEKVYLKPCLEQSSRPKLSSRPSKMFNSSSNQERIQECLELVNSLLKKDRIDANLLGIQSLQMLTNPDISGLDSAIIASKVVLYGAPHNCIKEKVQLLVQHCRLHEDDDESEEEQDEFEYKHYSQMRNHALCILSNSLEILSSQGMLQLEEDSWLANTFVSILLSDLKQSSLRPHDGTMSAKCLCILVKQSNAIRQRALKRGAMDILYSTLLFSRCANDSLTDKLESPYLALNCK